MMEGQARVFSYDQWSRQNRDYAGALAASAFSSVTSSALH